MGSVARNKACFFASLPRLFPLSRALTAPLARVLVFACRRRSIPQEWAATENPAAALLPSDSLVAHLPACRAADSDLTALTQGRTIDARKLRFAESPLSDSQQIARVYRGDGLFFGTVKIENDTARATLVAVIGITNDNSAHRGRSCRYSRSQQELSQNLFAFNRGVRGKSAIQITRQTVRRDIAANPGMRHRKRFHQGASAYNRCRRRPKIAPISF